MKLVKSSLGEITLEFKTGKTPPTSNPDYFGDEINWYTPTDLDREKILGKSVRGITKKALDDKKVVVLKPNTILLGCIGDIGKIGLIKESASSNQQITGILPKQELVNSEFLYYWLKCNKNRLKDTSTSAIVPILNNKQLAIVKIEYPEKLSDQIRIAEILSQAEALIAQRKQSINLLDELLKSTFLEMFGDVVRNEKKWTTIRLDKIAKLERGRFSPRPRNDPSYFNGAYPFIQTGDISKSGNRLNSYTQTLNEKGIKVSKKFNKGTIVIAIVGATIGATAILEIEVYATDSIIGITTKKEITNNYFLEFTMQCWKPTILKNAPEAARANINLEILNKLKIILPPFELQTRFAAIVEKVESLKTQYQQSLTELQNMYGVLSQKAFKGELSLSEANIKEKVL